MTLFSMSAVYGIPPNVRVSSIGAAGLKFIITRGVCLALKWQLQL